MSLIDKFKKTATPITPTIPAPIAQAQPIPPSSAPPARRMVIQDESTPIEPVAKPPEPAPAFVTGAWYETSKGTGQCMGRTASAFAFEGQTGKFLIGFTESTMWKEIPEPMPESTHTATPTPSEETTQESTQKRGRGRPAGVKNRTPEQIAADTRAEMAPPAHVKAEPGTSTATPIPWSSGQGFRLFVDCVPSGPSQNLARYIAEKAEKVCKALDEDDIRLVEYGKGKGALAAVVREELPADGDWVVYSGELSSIVIEALEPLAAFVVRGVR